MKRIKEYLTNKKLKIQLGRIGLIILSEIGCCVIFYYIFKINILDYKYVLYGILYVQIWLPVIFVARAMGTEEKMKQFEFNNFFKKNRIKSRYLSEEYTISRKQGTLLVVCVFIIEISLVKIDWINSNISIVNREAILTVVIGITSMAVAAVIGISLFNKDYYLFFSFNDIMKLEMIDKYNKASLISFSVVIISSLIYGIDTMLKWILVDGIIINIYSNINILYKILKIILFDSKTGLRCLEKLHNVFNIAKLDKTEFRKRKEWSYERLKANAEYIVVEYVAAIKKLKKIKKIEFGTVFKEHRDKLQKKIKIRKYIAMVFFSMTSFALCDIKQWLEFIEIMLLSIIPMVVVDALPKEGSKNEIKNAEMLLYYGSWGYFLYYGGEKIKFSSLSSIIRTNRKKNLDKMNNLNAFFYITLNYLDKKEHRNIEIIFNDVINDIENNTQVDEKTMTVYFPIFTIGYLFYEKRKKINKVKELYKEIVKESERDEFEKVFDVQICYLTKYENLNREISFENEIVDNKKVSNYLMWLKD